MPKLFRYGSSLERVAGGLAHLPALNPERPLRKHGTTLVTEYPTHLEGVVLACAGGAVLVEGRWYRDSLPEALRNAMKDFREASRRNRSEDGRRVLDAFLQQHLEEHRDALLAERRAFETPSPNAGAGPA